VDGVEVVVALDGGAEWAAPDDVGGEMPVGDAGVPGVPAGLQLGGQGRSGLPGFPGGPAGLVTDAAGLFAGW
jgi:hypothetical protein